MRRCSSPRWPPATLHKAADALDQIRSAQGETEIVGNLEGLFQLAQIDLPGRRQIFAGLVQKYPDFAAGQDQSGAGRHRCAATRTAPRDPGGCAGQAADRRTGADDAGVRLCAARTSCRTRRRVLERAHRAEPARRGSPSPWAICISGPASRRRHWTWRRAKKAPNADSPDILQPEGGGLSRSGAEEGGPGDLQPNLLKQDPPT